ncbi:MAG: MgtC/SapB family protein [Eubacteriales bacterium]|nr:MgtC/SapB family protein [Eubacteriales bacterium]
MDILITTNPLTWYEVLIRVVAAVVVGALVGIDREYKNRPAGLRTHSLVCLGSTVVAILEGLLVWRLLALDGPESVNVSIGRISAQVVSGIGFLGAGTIFVAQKKVSGLTTAAGLWNVACLGLLIGFGYYWLALIVAGMITVVLVLFQKLIRVNTVKRVEVRFTNRASALPFINAYMHQKHIEVLDVDFHIETFRDAEAPERNVYTNLYTLHLPPGLSYADMVMQLTQNKDIQVVRTRNV